MKQKTFWLKFYMHFNTSTKLPVGRLAEEGETKKCAFHFRVLKFSEQFLGLMNKRNPFSIGEEYRECQKYRNGEAVSKNALKNNEHRLLFF